MKRPALLIFLMIVAAISVTGCVSKKKFLASEMRTANCKLDSTRLQDSLAMERNTVRQLNGELELLKKDNEDLRKNMSEEIAKKQEELKEKEKKLSELQAIVDNLNNKVEKLRQTITKAMESFKNDEISVYIKDGKVYVSLSEKLLFKTGSTKVDPMGIDALVKLAGVLNSTPEINVTIEGHTDNVGSANSNWDLSVMRATSIIRILTENSVDPNRVIASGRGQFFPVSENETPEGRAKNRRTEIILSPDLKEFFDILGTK